MFDLGSLWIAPEFIVSVSINTDTEDISPEWRSYVQIRTTTDMYRLYMPDYPGDNYSPHIRGLAAAGYGSLEEFCAKLLAAIKDAKK